MPDLEQALEEMGRLIDTTDNYLAAKNLKLPDSINAEALFGGMEEIKEKLREIYFSLGGEDVWEGE
jgi:hypothetical protein